MIRVNAIKLELAGTHYEVGEKLGKLVGGTPRKKLFPTPGRRKLHPESISRARELLDRWCPGINEEIRGFAAALGMHPDGVNYYPMTYLQPQCSQIVLLPGLTGNGHVLLARNYEFTHRLEHFTLTRTSIDGRYAHLGTSVCRFGRDEGLNEHGLAVSMSSCGFPVGALEGMREPGLPGLQFWAVIRTLLENCRDTAEALSFLEGMPIAYNINLILADASGHAALVETIDGARAINEIKSGGSRQYLHVTNHAVLPELKQYEPKVMRHSLTRYERIRQYLDNADGITADNLKDLLLGSYPEGLCCHYYNDFFGTTKSIVMDLNDGRVDLCWGGLESNGWRSYRVMQPLDDGADAIEIREEKAPPGLFDFI